MTATRATRARSAPPILSPSRATPATCSRCSRARWPFARWTQHREDVSPLIGNSPAMQKLRLQLRQYADLPFPVLIEGESGSGKEIIASRCLHRYRSGATDRFWRSIVPRSRPTWSKRRLFGYARGAFTGAIEPSAGYFEDAADGTLFLDEIGELALDLQAKLLRVLENGEYQRVGETQQARQPGAHHRRHQPRPAQGGQGRQLPRRSLPPPVGLFDRCPAAARDGRRQAAAARALPAALRRADAAASLQPWRRKRKACGGLRLSRQRARAAQHRHPPDHPLSRGRSSMRRRSRRNSICRTSRRPARVLPAVLDGYQRRRSSPLRRSACGSANPSVSIACSTPPNAATSKPR
jgi:hypothetical protein